MACIGNISFCLVGCVQPYRAGSVTGATFSATSEGGEIFYMHGGEKLRKI